MAEKPLSQFERRSRQASVPPSQPQPPAKRSGHVALLVMGTIAVGSTAFVLMPSSNCEPASPGLATPSTAECQARSSSSSHGGSGGSSRYGYYGSDSSSHSSSGTTSDSGGVQRGGFGSFAHGFTSHFSGGG
jgi:hypothetical protein